MKQTREEMAKGFQACREEMSKGAEQAEKRFWAMLRFFQAVVVVGGFGVGLLAFFNCAVR